MITSKLRNFLKASSRLFSGINLNLNYNSFFHQCLKEFLEISLLKEYLLNIKNNNYKSAIDSSINLIRILENSRQKNSIEFFITQIMKNYAIFRESNIFSDKEFSDIEKTNILFIHHKLLCNYITNRSKAIREAKESLKFYNSEIISLDLANFLHSENLFDEAEIIYLKLLSSSNNFFRIIAFNNLGVLKTSTSKKPEDFEEAFNILYKCLSSISSSCLNSANILIEKFNISDFERIKNYLNGEQISKIISNICVSLSLSPSNDKEVLGFFLSLGLKICEKVGGASLSRQLVLMSERYTQEKQYMISEGLLRSAIEISKNSKSIPHIIYSLDNYSYLLEKLPKRKAESLKLKEESEYLRKSNKGFGQISIQLFFNNLEDFEL